MIEENPRDPTRDLLPAVLVEGSEAVQRSAFARGHTQGDEQYLDDDAVAGNDHRRERVRAQRRQLWAVGAGDPQWRGGRLRLGVGSAEHGAGTSGEYRRRRLAAPAK